VAADWANRPVNYVSFWSAARFANWLNNGQPTGPQGPGTTEGGAYHDVGNQTLFGRNAGAKFFIPTENEWYKAAYHKNDGVTGNYWDYPTASDYVPGNTLPDPGKHANFYGKLGEDCVGNCSYTIGDPYYLTNVGEFANSPSPYGTFDQGGNVWEWNETKVSSSTRGLRGGSFGDVIGTVGWQGLYAGLRLTDENVPSPLPSGAFGFRVASIPQPGSVNVFWRGNLDSNWSTIRPTAVTNWKTDATGATETFALPGPGTDVFFTTSDHGANLATTLGTNFSIKGLTFTSNAISPVSIGGTSGLTLGVDGLIAQSGAAAATINCPVVLAASQTWSNGSANPLTVNGNVSLGSSTLRESGSGVIVLAGSQTFGNNSAVNVTGGTMRFNSTALASSIGTGVVVSIDNGAQLELANSGSALSDETHFAKITNDSQLAAGGLLVTGTNQRVGPIFGAGDTVIASGASLIANCIQQNALEIGGTAGSPSLLTIAASDAAGNPLDGGPLLSSMSGGSVPEPSGLLLIIIAAALLGGLRCAAGPYRRGSSNHHESRLERRLIVTDENR
jgi:hypothetical protein